jgi:uncharacterized phage protein (TIGR02220 family)
MGANCGWVKLYRKILENPYWQSEPFSRGQAWVDLLLMANHKPGFVRKQGVRIDLSPGDIGMSETELAARWQWSRGKVRRFIEELEVDGMVQKGNTETDRRKFVLSICNYSKYQDQNSSDGTGDGPTTVQANLPKSSNSAEIAKKRGTGDGPEKNQASDRDCVDIETSKRDDGTGDSTGDRPTTVQATDRRRYKNKNDKNEENEKKKDIVGLRAATAREAIDILNEIAGTGFKHTKTNVGHVSARLAEGFTLDNVRSVVTSRVALWGDDPSMRQYLRPQTVFGSKFDAYLQAASMPYPSKGNGNDRSCATCQHHTNPLCQSKTDAERQACTGWRSR